MKSVYLRRLARVAVLGLTALGLAACAASETGTTNRLGSAVAARLTGKAPTAVPAYAALETSGGPQMQAVTERLRSGDLLRLQSQRDGVQRWIGRYGPTFSMRDGMLVSSRGSGGDLMAADVMQSARLIHARQSGQAQRFHSYLDGANQIVTRSYICDVKDLRPYDLTLGSRVYPTRYLSETCYGQGDRFTNYYWVDSRDGVIRQSRQRVSAYTGLVAFRQILQ